MGALARASRGRMMPSINVHNEHLRRAIALLPDATSVAETAIEIQQIPAPTFAEQARADDVRRRFERIGLADVAQDETGNVYGCRRGQGTGAGIVLAAHLDTVFPIETDLTVRRDGNVLHGPGIGDNSLGVAGLLHIATIFEAADVANQADIWYVADVCEEGLGDLRGMRAALDKFENNIGAVIAIEGAGFGRIYHRAIGVTRLRVEARAPGGHSWADYGAPSAIHLLVEIAAALAHLPMPLTSRATLNIGVIQGGTTVNAIAESAHFLLDLRSEQQSTLETLLESVKEAIGMVPCPEGAAVSITTVGKRESGSIPLTAPLAQAAAAALAAVGVDVVWGSGSTDANVPLARGIPAICVGLAHGGNAHRLDEHLDITDLRRGMEALVRLVWIIAHPEQGA